jgi:SAM-dependent methyltransferase
MDGEPLFPGAEKHSITHHQLFGVIATELGRHGWPATRPLRILDMGCGNGLVMGFLHAALAKRLPGVPVDIHGFDIAESKVQHEGFIAEARAHLAAANPTVDWSSRVRMIGASEPWPYADGAFDFVVSNQVMEHVRDHHHVFAEIARVMARDGVSVHLFPLRTSWMEWHVRIPFAHWIRDGDLLESYIRACSVLGLGTWRSYCRRVAPISVDEYARQNRDFICFETHYLEDDDLADLANRYGLRPSFRFTAEFYANRIRKALGRPLRYEFSPGRNTWLRRLALLAFKRISSIVLVLEKKNEYVSRGLHDVA